MWLLNSRGNTYSRNHTQLDPCSTCKEFWSFGVEEGALLDYPAVLNYITATTGYEDVHFVGYSMGTTQYLMLLSEMPGKWTIRRLLIKGLIYLNKREILQVTGCKEQLLAKLSELVIKTSGNPLVIFCGSGRRIFVHHSYTAANKNSDSLRI